MIKTSKAVMKKSIYLLHILLILLFIAGCAGKGGSKKGAGSEAAAVTVTDTGYTGIKQFYSHDKLIKEVTYKNGVVDGETRTYYSGGQLYQTFNYVNGHKQDTARWYYAEGQVFRATPFRNDTVDGIQKQYYRNGRLKAKIGYLKGHRTPLLEEFTATGKLITDYPSITFSIEDNYFKSGSIRVNLATTDKQAKVKFYRGEFINGVFDSTKYEGIRSIDGRYYVDLKKTGTEQPGYINIIASIITGMGNNYLTGKKIELPYKDLK